MLKLTGYVKDSSMERLLSLIPGDNRELYEDDAEDVQDQIREKDLLHPEAYVEKFVIEEVKGENLLMKGVELHCKKLAEELAAGDPLYICLSTAGLAMNQYLLGMEDPLQNYILSVYMSTVLNEGLIEGVRALVETEGGDQVAIVFPGIDAGCEQAQQENLAILMKEAFHAAGVSVLPGGSLSPTYSTTAILSLKNGKVELCRDWNDQEARDHFAKALNQAAGHM